MFVNSTLTKAGGMLEKQPNSQTAREIHYNPVDARRIQSALWILIDGMIIRRQADEYLFFRLLLRNYFRVVFSDNKRRSFCSLSSGGSDVKGASSWSCVATRKMRHSQVVRWYPNIRKLRYGNREILSTYQDCPRNCLSKREANWEDP